MAQRQEHQKNPRKIPDDKDRRYGMDKLTKLPTSPLS